MSDEHPGAWLSTHWREMYFNKVDEVVHLTGENARLQDIVGQYKSDVEGSMVSMLIVDYWRTKFFEKKQEVEQIKERLEYLEKL